MTTPTALASARDLDLVRAAPHRAAETTAHDLFRLSLSTLGWDVSAVDLDLVRGTARIELRCADRLVTFDARDGRVTTTREIVETEIVRTGRRGDSYRAERLRTRFIGRERHKGIRSGLRWLASYVAENGVRPALPSDTRRIFALLFATGGPVTTPTHEHEERARTLWSAHLATGTDDHSAIVPLIAQALAEAEAPLRAEIERLTRERDELRGALRTIERRLRVDAAPLVPLVNAHGGPREREAWRAVYSSAIFAQGWVRSTCGATITTRHGDHAQHVCALPAGHDGEHEADGVRWT